MWNGHLWFRVEGPFVARRSIVTVLIVPHRLYVRVFEVGFGFLLSLVLFLVLTGLEARTGPCDVVAQLVRESSSPAVGCVDGGTFIVRGNVRQLVQSWLLGSTRARVMISRIIVFR